MSHTPNKGAGMRDLSAAVATVHNHRLPVPLEEEIDPTLLVAAGDAPDRDSYFDHDETRLPFEKDGVVVHLTMGQRALLFDYRTLDSRRANRALMTIPPKVRDNIRTLYGLAEDDDYLITTTLVALADYAAMMLLRDGKRLHISPAPDAREEERRDIRKKIARANP